MNDRSPHPCGHNAPECGHSEEEHEMMADLVGAMRSMTVKAMNPRVAVVMDDDGDVHFASTLTPGEAATVLMRIAERVRRYGGNYVHDHYDRGQAAQWN